MFWTLSQAHKCPALTHQTRGFQMLIFQAAEQARARLRLTTWQLAKVRFLRQQRASRASYKLFLVTGKRLLLARCSRSGSLCLKSQVAKTAARNGAVCLCLTTILLRMLPYKAQRSRSQAESALLTTSKQEKTRILLLLLHLLCSREQVLHSQSARAQAHSARVLQPDLWPVSSGG